MAMVLAGAGSAAKPVLGVTAAPQQTAAVYLGPRVVRQVGARNYAGPNCPGAGWNCTTSTRVLQVATAGGQNVAQCTDGTATSASNSQGCSINQTGTNNTARCIEHMNAPSATQTCDVTQTGAKNKAVIEQMLVSTSSAAATGNQIATVTQTSSGGGNDLNLSQKVDQNTGGNDDDSSTAGTQTQDAFQSATVVQTVALAGNNKSQIDQSQRQHAHGAPMQQQNLGASTLGDCAPAVGGFAPNVCANVAQHAGTGNNSSNLNQSIDEKAKSNDANADQEQGQFSGGIDGQVHQDTAIGGPGTNQSTADQKKHQEASAPSGAFFQSQTDPVSCCGFASQIGGTNSQETIHESADLNASEGLLAGQEIDLLGLSNSPNGTCTFDQHASLNNGTQSNTGTLSPCPDGRASMFCSSGNIDAPVLTDAVVANQELNEPCFVIAPTTNGD
jgi:hypothetical protein